MSGRITALDVLRGVAILGTLGTNIWVFTSPRGAPSFIEGFGSAAAGGAESVLLALSNGKFLALLSILFGVGLALQHGAAVRRGARWPGWYLWRSALLLLEGLAHYLLIFEFDVLMWYAVVSVFVAYLVGRHGRVINRWMVAAGVVHLAFVGLVTAALVAGEAEAGGAPVPGDTTNWLAQVAARVEFFATYRAEVFFVLPLSTLLFLAGARLLRAGALEDSDRGRRLRVRLIGWGLGAGVPMTVAAGVAGGDWFLFDRYVCAPVVAFGLLGLVTSLVLGMRPAPGLVRRGLTSVGRMALTCYIAQNLIASIVFYQWGFGLAAHVGSNVPLWTAVGWLLISAVLMAAASWWLGRFSRGPVEAFWQWAYQAPQRRREPQPVR
ncbi:DUF418 domain-containing protein [Actinokineospora iranica]|uniref:DUF418 domain-containing protein n=1 Tax=Actinokineospora iranica TaxID=1271860 RepID=A0A1G6S448_9PSEU|nr:DUF418 domain-containing protein [Actinokineospora iranica]SDD11454.1 uncharacterized protein SAMN05216174_107206 [Actinokineospora iranica]